MFQEMVKAKNGKNEMTVTKYTSIANSTNYSVPMQNGVYFMSRTDATKYASYVKGYVENGVLSEIGTYSGITVSYTNGTLTVNKGTVSIGTNDLYFFVMD